MVNDFKPVPVFRCTYLNHFMETFREIGLDVNSDLCTSQIPDEFLNRNIEYVPAHPALAFIIDTANKNAIEGLGLKAGLKLDPSSFGDVVRRGLSQATTLGDALNTFCLLVNQEQSHVRCRLSSTDGKKVKIRGAVAMNHKLEECQYSEWILIMSVISIIRYATSQIWCPKQITFQSQPQLCESEWKAFPGTQFHIGQPDTSVSIPQEMLSLAWPDCRTDIRLQPARPLSVTASEKAWDFPESLCMALKPYLNGGYPSIKLAAEISGTSVRTLQRRLSQCRLSYSDLIKQLRFDISIDMLCDPDKKVLDTALELGFTDPSHFSRAFRHMTGVSPREFRKLQAA